MFPTIDTPLQKVALFCAIVGVAGFLLMVLDSGETWHSVVLLAFLLFNGSLAVFPDFPITVSAIFAIILGGLVIIIGIPTGMSWIFLTGAALAIVWGGDALHEERKISASEEDCPCRRATLHPSHSYCA